MYLHIIVCIGEFMKQQQREFLKETDYAMRVCSEIEFILNVIRDYCEYNEDTNPKFLGLTLMSEILLAKVTGYTTG